MTINCLEFMENKESKSNKQRTSFSKKTKRKALLEFAKGKKPQEIVLNDGEIKTTDKKYVAKLLHKWRKEAYQNKEILNLLSHQITQDMIDEEIENLGSDDEECIGISEKEIEFLKNAMKKNFML